jgi:hypothetical protein
MLLDHDGHVTRIDLDVRGSAPGFKFTYNKLLRRGGRHELDVASTFQLHATPL